MPEQIEACVDNDEEEGEIAQVKYDQVHAVRGDRTAVRVVENLDENIANLSKDL